MKRSQIAIALASACALSLTPLIASDQGTRESQTGVSPSMTSETPYQRLDLNQDGWIGRDEAMADPTLSDQYINFDQDGNGYISPSEFSAFEERESAPPVVPPYGATMAFEELDANKDGRLVREEAIHEPRLDQRYSSIDQDRDDYISQSEFSAFEKEMETRTPSRSSPAPGMEGGEPISFEEMDANKDGNLSSDELSRQSQVLGEMDTNMDGKVSRQEYEAVMAMQRPGPKISMESLDRNRDNCIDAREAQAVPSLYEQFDSFDTDQDRLIDRSEFSVFESFHEITTEGGKQK